MRYAAICRVGTLLLLLAVLPFTGCDLLDQNPAAVKTQISGLAGELAGSNWAAAEKRFAPTFVYLTERGAQAKSPSAPIYLGTLKALGSQGGCTLTPTRVAKVSANNYLAVVEVELRGVKWTQRQVWTKSGQQWQLTEIKELSARTGQAAPAPATASRPAAPATVPTPAGETAAAATMQRELQQAPATNSVQQEARRRMTDRLKQSESAGQKRSRQGSD
jgi:hypothetical protein